MLALMVIALARPDTGLPPGALDRLGSLTFKHGSNVGCVAFSPDGRRLATGSNTNSSGAEAAVKVWDLASGELLMRAECEATAVCFAGGSGKVAASSRDGSGRIWEVASGRELVRAESEKSGWAVGVAVSPDGKLLATVHGNAPGVSLYDAVSGVKRHDLLPPNGGQPGGYTHSSSVAFTPDGQSVAAGVPGVGLVFWDAATGQRGRTLAGDYHGGFGFDGSPVVFDGRGTRAAVPMGEELGLYAPQTGELRQSIRASTSPSRMATRPLALSGDGKTLLLVRNGDVKLWDVAADKELRQVFHGVVTPTRVALSPDAKYVAYVENTFVVVEEAASGQRLHAAGSHDGPVWRVGFGPAGGLYTSDGKLRVWDTGPNPKRRGVALPIDHVVEISPDGRTAVCGGYTAKPRVIDIATGRETVKLDLKSIGVAPFTAIESVISATFAPHDRLLTVGTDWRVVTLWDLKTGKRLRDFRGHGDPVDAVAVSPDGKQMTTGGSPRAYIRSPGPDYVADTGARVWNLETGKELRQIPFRAGTIQYSPDGKLLAMGIDAGVSQYELRLVDAATGKLVRNLPVGRLGSAQVAFSPDGSELVSVGRDKFVRLFDVATGVERRQYRGHIGPPYAVAFSPDGKRLLTGGVGGLAFLWDVMPKNGRGDATAVNP